MTDAEFATAFEAGQIPPAEFGHLGHLRVAWACLREADSVPAATDRIRAAITRFAASIGKSDKYHETLTVFWMIYLARVQARAGAEREFLDVLGDHPELTDRRLANRFYDQATLDSDEARRRWIAPEHGTLDA